MGKCSVGDLSIRGPTAHGHKSLFQNPLVESSDKNDSRGVGLTEGWVVVSSVGHEVRYKACNLHRQSGNLVRPVGPVDPLIPVILLDPVNPASGACPVIYGNHVPKKTGGETWSICKITSLGVFSVARTGVGQTGLDTFLGWRKTQSLSCILHFMQDTVILNAPAHLVHEGILDRLLREISVGQAPSPFDPKPGG